MRLLLLLIIAALPAWAGFVRTSQPVKLDFGQKEVTVIFEADSAVTKAKPLCECTKVRVEGNKIIAHVDTSGFSQDVEKQIDATTKNGSVTRLTMRFSVPQAVELSARSLIWSGSQQAVTKTLTINIPKGSPVHDVKEASISGEAFDYTPRIVQKGAQYCVDITPRSVDKKALNRLIIKTDSADPRYEAYIVYLSIQP